MFPATLTDNALLVAVLVLSVMLIKRGLCNVIFVAKESLKVGLNFR